MKRTYILSLLLQITLAGCHKEKFINDNNPDGLNIVNNIEVYRKQVIINPDFELLDISAEITDMHPDIRYATTSNFTRRLICKMPKACARQKVVETLAMVQDPLKKLKLGLKIYDSCRPYAATFLFYEIYPDTNFVTNPCCRSHHNRACAVDVSLVDISNGQKIKIPKPFDEFSERVHPEYMNLDHEVIDKRTLLFGVMQHFGFMHYPTEWWHFDIEGCEVCLLMDIPFDIILSENFKILWPVYYRYFVC